MGSLSEASPAGRWQLSQSALSDKTEQGEQPPREARQLPRSFFYSLLSIVHRGLRA